MGLEPRSIRVHPADLYRVLDGMYRVQELLFRIEDESRRARHTQFRIARMRTSTSFGAAVAGLVGITPILLELTGTRWLEGRALWFYAGMMILMMVWLVQIREAKKAEREIAISETDALHVPLVERPDYLNERATQFGYRIRLLREASALELGRADEALIPAPRYKEIEEYCRKMLTEICDQADLLFSTGKWTDGYNDSVFERSRPFLSEEYISERHLRLENFASRGLQGTPSPKRGWLTRLAFREHL